MREVLIGNVVFRVVQLPELADVDGASCGARADWTQRVIFINGSFSKTFREMALWKAVANERQYFCESYLVVTGASPLDVNQNEQPDDPE